MMKTRDNTIKLSALTSVVIFLIYMAAYYFRQQNNVFSAVFLVLSGFFFYLWFSLRNQVNLLDFKAVFSGVWMVTIGLSQLSLLKYQVNWAFATWLNLSVAHVVFVLANDGSTRLFYPVLTAFRNISKRIKLNHQPLIVKEERLFWIAMTASIIGFLSFIANVLIKGYIPFFTIGSSSSAYYDFYTRFQIFYVASLASVGLSYYCIKRLTLSKTKRRLLWMNIIVLNFLLPILLVQRGTFLNTMLIFTAVVYNVFEKRRFKPLVICLTLMVSIYFLGSYLRGFSNTQLAFLFQPKEIEVCPDKTDPDSLKCVDPEDIPLEGKKYVISSTVAFLYSYLTVSHDNFNSAVEKTEHYTYGVWQIRPFNVVLRNTQLNEWIEEAEKDSVKLQVLPHLNSFNLITSAYLDFGLFGVIFLMMLWSFLFGMIENYQKNIGGIFSNIALGICLIPIVLGFFLPWMSDFVPYLYFGSTWLMFLASSVSFGKSQK